MVFFLLGWAGLTRVLAQNGSGTATLFPPNTDAFPLITVLVDVHDSQGAFVHHLTPAEISPRENDKTLPVTELREIQSGVRMVVAINAGQILAIRDRQGNTRYNTIQQALQNWAITLKSDGPDDYSLVTSQGTLAAHTHSPSEWLQALSGFTQDMRTAQPSLSSLSQAIDLASDSAPQAGMERAVLYVTPLLDQTTLAGISDLNARARQSNVHVFIWLVASPVSPEPPEISLLRQLSNETQGQLFIFSGVESLPDPNIYLEPFRTIYQLSYSSAIRTNGSSSLLVSINQNDFQATSNLQVFPVNLLPPNPIFVSPPVQIARTAPVLSTNLLQDLAPSQQSLDILVEFPDGFKRPLAFTRLYVDGKPVAENTAEPFTHFNWDLSSITVSGQHTLMVEAKDSLGLARTSAGAPVEIIVSLPKKDMLSSLTLNKSSISAAVAIAASGGVLAIVLVAGLRIRARAKSRPRTERDPLTQMVKALESSYKPPFPAWYVRLSRSRHPGIPQVPARLIRLDMENRPLPSAPVPVDRRMVTIGHNPTQADLVLDSDSVSEIHARLEHQEDGSFVLCDENSVAGTWVNYAPVQSEGTCLKHGDVIHFGQVPFRFQLENPLHTPKPQIKPYRENL